MAERIDRAVMKASRARLLADFREAARALKTVGAIRPDGSPYTEDRSSWARGYAVGLIESATLTRAAALLTAFER